MKDKQEIVENDPVSKLLGSLKRVQAPGDFDFRVKSRIASGRPVDRNASWLPNLVRLALPLGLLVMIGGYFGYNALYSAGNIAVAPVAVVQDVVPIPEIKSTEPAIQPANEIVAKQVESKPVDADNKSTLRPNEKRIVSSVPSNRKPGGGSVDIASGISNPLRPKGFETNRKILPATVSAREVLSFVGVEVDSSWKVGSVLPNSMAERSGLKTGDVIEAINNENVADKTAFGNKSIGKTIRVRRDDKSVQIDLKP